MATAERTKRAKSIPQYRSGLEKVVSMVLEKAGIEARHEVTTLYYIVPATRRRYVVDFSLPKHKDIVLEAKGKFTSADRKKMLYIKEQHPDKTIVMLFGKSRNRLNKQSATTYADWCDKNGIKWIDLKDFEENPECLLSMTKKKAGSLKTPRPKRSTVS